MNKVNRLRGVVYRTLDIVNGLLPADQALEATDNLVLIGRNASLDSMGFVNFIVALEEELERELGKEMNIADLLNLQHEDSEAETISTVADLVNVLSERLS